MGPRKRLRRDPQDTPPGSSISLPATIPLQPSLASTTSQVTTSSATSSTTTPRQEMPPPPLPEADKSNASTLPLPQTQKKVPKTRSWYGSWPRKSAASTQLARETITGGTLKAGSTPDFSRYDTKKNGETTSLSGASQSSVNLPNIPENGAGAQKQQDKAPNGEPLMAGGSSQPGGDLANHGNTDTPEHTTEVPTRDPPEADTPQRPVTSSAWLGWFSRPSAPEMKPSEAEPVSVEPPKEIEEEPRQEPAGEESIQQPEQPPSTDRPATSYWFNFWSSSGGSEDSHKEEVKPPESASKGPKDPEDVVMEDAPPADPEPAPKPKAGSTWAFWSRDPPKSPGRPAPAPESGELAVIGERSESHPKRANSIDMGDTRADSIPPKEVSGKAKMVKDKADRKNKRLRPQPVGLDNASPARPSTPQSDTASIKGEATSVKTGSVKTGSNTNVSATTKPLPSNSLLPSFKNTYHMKENPSILRQVTQLLLRTQQPPANHVFLTKEPPKIKKALSIGVHGLFPASYLRPMVGQPTGTSIKFANHGAEGIRRWADSHGCEDCEIEKVALEGEGKIADRVENLWKLLLNWIEDIRKADLIILSCHSQGVPVSVMLLAKLIELGIITNAKIGVCAMAGVSLGPFPDYKSGMGMLMGSAAELWEFANSDSDISKRYESSLKAILAYGVRIAYIGSIDDQLVPIESAIYSPASHPYIYRAIFIDGRVHAPDFIAHLVGFACKLRNLGISDHGLIRELSVPLAGSLYGGEGHSRLYDDGQVYDLAIAHTLETTNVGNVSCTIQKYSGLSNPNPYHLPWIMRGLLEEDFVKTELSSEVSDLLNQFDDWKPVTKALKDVKYRLEAVRSKL